MWSQNVHWLDVSLVSHTLVCWHCLAGGGPGKGRPALLLALLLLLARVNTLSLNLEPAPSSISSSSNRRCRGSRCMIRFRLWDFWVRARVTRISDWKVIPSYRTAYPPACTFCLCQPECQRSNRRMSLFIIMYFADEGLVSMHETGEGTGNWKLEVKLVHEVATEYKMTYCFAFGRLTTFDLELPFRRRQFDVWKNIRKMCQRLYHNVPLRSSQKLWPECMIFKDVSCWICYCDPPPFFKCVGRCQN